MATDHGPTDVSVPHHSRAVRRQMRKTLLTRVARKKGVQVRCYCPLHFQVPDDVA